MTRSPSALGNKSSRKCCPAAPHPPGKATAGSSWRRGDRAESRKGWKNPSFSSLLLLQPLKLMGSSPPREILVEKKKILLALYSVLAWCVEPSPSSRQGFHSSDYLSHTCVGFFFLQKMEKCSIQCPDLFGLGLFLLPVMRAPGGALFSF